MEAILANRSVSVTELKRSFSEIINQADDGAIAVLNHNKPEAYLLPARMFERLMAHLEDLEDAKLVNERANGTFVEVLNTNRLLSGAITDPLSDDSAGNFRYFRFPAGSFGCPAANGAFYVLGIADMETSDGEHHLSPGWSCPSRDFQEEMEYVVGKYEQ